MDIKVLHTYMDIFNRQKQTNRQQQMKINDSFFPFRLVTNSGTLRKTIQMSQIYN